MATSCCGCSFTDTNIITNSCSSGFALFMSIVEALILSRCDIAEPCRRLGKDSAEFPPLPDYDFVVVGAGVAGPVIASRLSEPRVANGDSWSVLLLEAGPEEPTATQIPAYAVAAVGTELDWKYTTEPQQKACLSNGGVCKWPRGKMVSGTGGMQGMMYTRGNRRIYDEWEVDGWSYDEVLPYFKRAENNKNKLIADDDYHGLLGPLTVQYFSQHPPLSEDLVKAGIELGYRNNDTNGKNQTGFVIAQMMVDDGMRASTSRMYLRPYKDRTNLRVAINAHVTRILFEGTRAYGVEYVDSKGNKNVVHAHKEVILSGGAVATPQLLMLSGVGPKDHLTELGIPVVADIPGVGKNLHNHVSIGVRFTVTDPSYQTLDLGVLNRYVNSHDGPMSTTGLTQNTAFMSSKYGDEDFPDLQVFFDGFSSQCSRTGQPKECTNGNLAGDCGRRSINARPTNVLTESKGFLKLRSADPFVHPYIQPEYLTVEKDVLVLVEGIKLIINVTKTDALKHWGFQLDKTKVKGCESEEFGTDEYWACVVMTNTGPENHQSGSVKMGEDGDPEAVLNPKLQVKGVGNLRVVDASIFPRVPNGNPIAAIVMAAEKLSDLIKEDWEGTDEYEERIVAYHPGDLINLLSNYYVYDK